MFPGGSTVNAAWLWHMIWLQWNVSLSPRLGSHRLINSVGPLSPASFTGRIALRRDHHRSAAPAPHCSVHRAVLHSTTNTTTTPLWYTVTLSHLTRPSLLHFPSLASSLLSVVVLLGNTHVNDGEVFEQPSFSSLGLAV
jgi:hypothetical protein